MNKEKILVQVRELFLRYGLKSISMDDISRHLGISKKTLYQFVESKKDLVEQIFRKHIEDEEEAIDEIVGNAKNAVEALVGISRYISELLREMSPTTLYDVQKYYGDIWKMIESLHQHYIYRIIKTNIEKGVEQKLFRPDLDADIIARLYVGKNMMLVNEEVFSLKDYNMETLYQQHLRYHIHGIASQKGLALLEKYTKQLANE